MDLTLSTLIVALITGICVYRRAPWLNNLLRFAATAAISWGCYTAPLQPFKNPLERAQLSATSLKQSSSEDRYSHAFLLL